MSKRLPETRTEIQISLGTLGAVRRGDVVRALGIPFAAPPVGPRRFSPPAPAEPWIGTRAADAFGPAPMQAIDPLSQTLGLLGDHELSEDCLTLNLWAPAETPEAGAPVMVWLHGGAFASGTAAGPVYDGEALCRRGGVVVVTLNYRVGALGFLYGGSNAGWEANLGLRDQIAALHFIRREVRAFGGDPEKLTLFGESAGAGSLVALLAMPEARGLFRRAIVQSAAPVGQLEAPEAAERAGVFAKELGGSEPDLEWLRSLPADALVAAQAGCAEPGPRRIGMFFAPVIEGQSLPQAPLAAIAAGAARDVELVIGTTAQEMQLYHLMEIFPEIPEALLPAFVATRIAGPDETRMQRAEALVALYAQGARDAKDHFFALETDASLFVPSTRLAERQAGHQPRTFMYRFRLGACHALDVPFVLGNLELPKVRDFAGCGADARRLSEALMDAWVAFARCGDPSHPGIGSWPPYAPPRRDTLEFGPEIRCLPAPNEERRAAWDAALENPA
jgi:para-nitrobenzyl esterase